MSTQQFQARWVFPVSSPPIRNGCVQIDQAKIVEVRAAKPNQAAIDLGNVALLPGFVNAHTHLEFSDLQQPLGTPGQPLPDWIRNVIAARQRHKSNPTVAIAQGLQESAARGTTHLADIVTVEPEDYPPPAQRVGLELFCETIAFSRGRADSSLDYAEEKLKQAAARKLRAGLSPHAPYTVHRNTVARLARLAADRNVPLAMHLAESRAEQELLATGGGPFRDLLEERSMWDDSAVPAGTAFGDYLEMLKIAPRALVIHGNYLAAADFGLLAQHRQRMTLVHCPRTHAYFNHDANPLPAALKAGARVVLGTDSRASNPDLGLLGEMRHLAAQHPGIHPAEVLRMATLGPAAALGQESTMGALTPGFMANLVAVELPDEDAADPFELLFGGSGQPVGVWYRGRRIVSAA